MRLAKYYIFRVRQAHTGETGEGIGANKGDYTHARERGDTRLPHTHTPRFRYGRKKVPNTSTNYIHTKGPPLKFLNNKK